jgi:hypothetical protein
LLEGVFHDRTMTNRQRQVQSQFTGKCISLRNPWEDLAVPPQRLGVGEGITLGEGAGVGVTTDGAVGEGKDVGDAVGVSAAVGVGVGGTVEVEAGAELAGGGKPGTGMVCWPFTLMVVSREISTAKPTRLVMMTMIASRAPRTSRLAGRFEWR